MSPDDNVWTEQAKAALDLIGARVIEENHTGPGAALEAIGARLLDRRDR